MSENDCPGCANLRKVAEDAEIANAELARQLTGMDLLMRRAGKTEVALRNELAKQREEEPEAESIKFVLAHWKRVLDHDRAKVPLSGSRAKCVRARLKERFTVEDLKRAIDGCAAMPYVGAQGRKASGSRRERHDDLTLICRDEGTVERFISYTEQEPVVKPPHRSGPTGVDAVLVKLEAVKQSKPGQWEAKCPGHEDRHASLSVAQGEKGAVLHCHAGCTPGDVAAAAGLDLATLFDPGYPVPRPGRQPDPLLAESELEQLAGNLTGNQRLLDRLVELRGWTLPTLTELGVGFDRKRLVLPIRNHQLELVNVLRYLPRRVDDQPKMLSARGRPRDLWPAPETLNGNVWLVEGEPDALSGFELGLPTVGLPGVNGWRPEWAARFAGRRVTVCMDCDEQGRKAAQAVYGSLRGVADVTILDLEPERTDGYDLSDYLIEGGDGPFLGVMADAIIEEFAA